MFDKLISVLQEQYSTFSKWYYVQPAMKMKTKQGKL